MTEYYRGQLLRDKHARKKSDDDGPLLVVVIPDCGQVKSLDDDTREMVMGTAANQEYGVSLDTQCIDVTYYQAETPGTYTFPVCRVDTLDPIRTGSLPEIEPTDAVVTDVLERLFTAVEHDGGIDSESFERLCMQANLSGPAILRAQRHWEAK